jgi:hypothetical protein
MKKFEPINYLHLFIIILAWSSPLWLDWKLIIAGILIYYIQLLIFGNCILTKLEFASKIREMTFYSYLLEKVGFKFNRAIIIILADYVFPYVILGLSLMIQIVLKINPFIKL